MSRSTLVVSIVSLLSPPATSSAPGGWKWMPFRAGSRKGRPLPANALGAMPYARRNARANASGER